VLNLILIPSFGAAGSCIAALASQYLCAMLCFILCTQHEQFSYHLKSFALYIITGLLLFALFYYSKSAGIDKLIAIGIGCFATALIMFVQFNRGNKFVTEPNT
ncbi:MAG TPA: polysaccharide biosynthesis C-terminal domain-containing protein, partial [Chitinophagaceae bacterium]